MMFMIYSELSDFLKVALKQNKIAKKWHNDIAKLQKKWHNV